MRWNVLPFVFLFGLQAASAQQKAPLPELDAIAEKFVGTFSAKVDMMTSLFTISYEADGWKVSGLFKERGRDIGGFDGQDIRYEKGVLTFKQKFFLKPRSEWKDGEKFTMRIVGNNIVGLPDRPGAIVRSFERVDATATPPPAVPAVINDPRRFLGTYQGTANDGHRGTLVIAEKAGALSYQVTWYTASGKIAGNTVGVDVRPADRYLTLVQRHLKKPSSAWHDNTTVRLELTGNSLVQTRQDGARWAPSASFTRVAK
jgi:hypothetical protein